MGYKRVSKNRICCIITLLLVSLAVFFSTSCGKTEKDLLRVSYLKVGKADAIISYREQAGPFSRIEDIMNISGIKEGVFSKIKDDITV